MFSTMPTRRTSLATFTSFFLAARCLYSVTSRSTKSMSHCFFIMRTDFITCAKACVTPPVDSSSRMGEPSWMHSTSFLCSSVEPEMKMLPIVPSVDETGLPFTSTVSKMMYRVPLAKSCAP